MLKFVLLIIMSYFCKNIKMNIGYCCISIGINEGKTKKDFITVNRSMIRKTFYTNTLVVISSIIVIFYLFSFLFLHASQLYHYISFYKTL